MKVLHVHLGERSYPIYAGLRLLDDAGLFLPHVRGRQVLIVSNETVAPLYLARVEAHFPAREYTLARHILPDGETYKNLAQAAELFTVLLERGYNRDCCLIAVGGGVVGDVSGFAAACYQRSVDFIQVPTTLLAQVDSSVGGKTAVNHPLGKNMIGAFHQPVAVVADIGTLASLPDREYRAGLAEVIKYGLIRDAEFFAWLEGHLTALLRRDEAALVHAIERSCRNKAEVVSADERESGLRATLNLGHTFGHAIETALGYCDWLHGEAVACGMVMAAQLSATRGHLPAADVARIKDILQRAGLPTRLPAAVDAAGLLPLMKRDKKSRKEKIILIVLEKIGSAKIADDCDEGLLRDTVSSFVAPGG